jgi:hypothetical protein
VDAAADALDELLSRHPGAQRLLASPVSLATPRTAFAVAAAMRAAAAAAAHLPSLLETPPRHRGHEPVSSNATSLQSFASQPICVAASESPGAPLTSRAIAAAVAEPAAGKGGSGSQCVSSAGAGSAALNELMRAPSPGYAGSLATPSEGDTTGIPPGAAAALARRRASTSSDASDGTGGRPSGLPLSGTVASSRPWCWSSKSSSTGTGGGGGPLAPAPLSRPSSRGPASAAAGEALHLPPQSPARSPQLASSPHGALREVAAAAARVAIARNAKGALRALTSSARALLMRRPAGPAGAGQGAAGLLAHYGGIGGGSNSGAAGGDDDSGAGQPMAGALLWSFRRPASAGTRGRTTAPKELSAGTPSPLPSPEPARPAAPADAAAPDGGTSRAGPTKRAPMRPHQN